MLCYHCGAVLNDRSFCPNCGTDVSTYKKIIYTSNYYYNEGLQKAQVRDLSGAINALRQSIRFNKNNVEARNLLGLVYFEMGEAVAAISEWVISSNITTDDNLAIQYLEFIQKNQSRVESINQTIKKYNQALTYCYQGSLDLAVIQLKKVLSIFQYKKVYIMLGINDASDKKDRVERFMTPMRKILDLVRELQPDATIYIISLTPVGRATPNLILYNRENTIFYSQMLKDLSREYGTEYLDVFRLLCDSEGYFKEGYSGDGIHLQAKYYPLFADFLRTHTC